MIFFSFCKISHIYKDIAILKRNLGTDYSNDLELPEFTRTQCDVTILLPKAHSRKIRTVRLVFFLTCTVQSLRKTKQKRIE